MNGDSSTCFLVNILIKWELYLISIAKVSGKNNGLWNSDTSSRHGLMIGFSMCPDAQTKPGHLLIQRLEGLWKSWNSMLDYYLDYLALLQRSHWDYKLLM